MARERIAAGPVGLRSVDDEHVELADQIAKGGADRARV